VQEPAKIKKQKVKNKRLSYPSNRPWRPIGLSDVVDPTLYRPGLSYFKQAVIYFLVSKLPVISPPLQSYLALSKNIGKNNTTQKKIGMTNISASKFEYNHIILDTNLHACHV
jgi:hypothetical protein